MYYKTITLLYISLFLFLLSLSLSPFFFILLFFFPSSPSLLLSSHLGWYSCSLHILSTRSELYFMTTSYIRHCPSIFVLGSLYVNIGYNTSTVSNFLMDEDCGGRLMVLKSMLGVPFDLPSTLSCLSIHL